MELCAEDIKKIVEGRIQLDSDNPYGIISQIRYQLLPDIRLLQRDGLIKWHSFLIHSRKQLKSYNGEDESDQLHVRMCPSNGVSVKDIRDKVVNIIDIMNAPVKNISGMSGDVFDGRWHKAWEMVGMSSEWALGLVESNPRLSVRDILQNIHYITNAFGIDECEYMGLIKF